METVSEVCEHGVDEHVWESEQTVPLQEAIVFEALQYDMEIPCTVQWRMVRFSAPISLNNELRNHGEIFGTLDYCDWSSLSPTPPLIRSMSIPSGSVETSAERD